MKNIGQIITNNNKAQLSNEKPTATCNCRDKSTCPLPNACLSSSVIYQATVMTKEPNATKQTYVGLTEGSFKKRYYNHRSSFHNPSKRTSTELSNYIWQLKDRSIQYDIKWRVLKKASSYNKTSKRCNLCIWEKYFILYKPELASLNSRNELVSKCRHSNKHLICNAVT